MLLEKWWSSDVSSVLLPGALKKECRAPEAPWISHRWAVVTCSVPSVPSPSAPVPLQFPRPFLGSSGALGDAVVLRKAGMPGRQQLVLVPRAGNPAWRLWLCQCFGGAVPAPGDCLWGLGLLHCCWKQGTVQNGSDTEPASKHGLFSLLLYIKPKAPSYCFGSCWRCSLSTEHFSCV